MQNLWSRIGKVGCSCRCPSCLQTKHALVRHVSTVASKLRARPKESATFIYSSIFATGALIDRHQKQQRRSHWDDALKRAREEVDIKKKALEKRSGQLGVEVQDDIESQNGEEEYLASQEELEAEGQVIAKGYYDATGHRPKIGFDNVRATGKGEVPIISRFTVEDVMKFAAVPGAERPPWAPTTIGLQYQIPTPNHLPPQSLWAGDIRRLKARNKPWSAKKLSVMELSIARLVLNLFIMMDVSEEPPSNLIVMPEVIRDYARLSRESQRILIDHITQELASAKSAESWERLERAPLGIPLPSYRMKDDGSHHEIARDLNDSLLSLLRAYKKGEISFKALILKICTNLLISPAPPDIQACNILLLGFHKLRLNQISKCNRLFDFWVGVLQETKMRPNEITCATILANYRKRNLADDFAYFVALMRGHFGGLMMAKPGIVVTEASQGRLVPHWKHPERIVQAVGPSAFVHQEVIKGVLTFAGIEQAVDICVNFEKSAWGLNWVCLWDLLLACLHGKDWERGLIVWGQVEVLSSRYRTPSRVIAAMLALCVECGQKEMFASIHDKELQEENPWPEFLEQAYGLVGDGERSRRFKVGARELGEVAVGMRGNRRRETKYVGWGYSGSGNVERIADGGEESPLEEMGEDMTTKGWNVDELGGETKEEVNEAVSFWDAVPTRSGNGHAEAFASQDAPSGNKRIHAEKRRPVDSNVTASNSDGNGIWDALMNLPPPNADTNKPTLNSFASKNYTAHKKPDENSGEPRTGGAFRWELRDEPPKMKSPRESFVRGSVVGDGEEDDDTWRSRKRRSG